MSETHLDVDWPEKLQCLFQPKRYKVLWGGRGAGRSWGVARALLLMGAGLLPSIRKPPLRVLCARELQKSIAESVHQILSDQVRRLKLEDYYIIQRDHIYGRHNDTIFSFEGLKNNVDKVKSYEGIDICWVEEAIKVTKTSWQVLIPTIRRESCPNGHKLPLADFERWEREPDLPDVCEVCNSRIEQSEIWMTFNPDLEEDYTYRRFVRDADPRNTSVVKMTWKDNPWFPRVSYDEMVAARETDEDTWLNVWEGFCRKNLEGAIFARELRKAEQEGRICTVPWEREWPVDTFWDLGRANHTCIWFGQRVAMQYRILAFYHNTGFDISHYIHELQRRGYTYGTHYLPHDAKAKLLGNKRTIEEQLRQANSGRVKVLLRTPTKSDSLNAARIIFPNCWFDEDECEEGLNFLRRYQYRQVNGKFTDEPEHDNEGYCDCGDAFQTLAMAIKSPAATAPVTIETGVMKKYRESIVEIARAGLRNPQGWMR